MKKTPLALLTLALSLCLCGCAASDLPDEEETTILPEGSFSASTEEVVIPLPQTLTLPWSSSATLDPITCPDEMQQTVGSLIFEGLFRLDDQFTPQAWLCESYSYDSEHLRYTFTLRPDVLFSDGAPLTAADVKATLDRARTSVRYGARLSAVTAVTARSGEVSVTLSSPNAAFPALLDIPIVKQGTQSIGTGPYLLSQGERGDILIANDAWWQSEPLPTSEIALCHADSYDAMLYHFNAREVQLITADLTGTKPTSLTGNIDRTEAPTTVLQYLGVNTARLPDAQLRAALSTLIDRKTIASAYLSGHASAAQFPLSPASPLYPKALETQRSTALPQQLTPPQRTLTLLVNEENHFKVSIARYVAERFTAAGVSTEVTALPWDTYLAELSAGNFDLYYGETSLTADWDVRNLVGTGGSINYGGWSDPETDLLLQAYLATGAKADMEALCRQVQKTAPILPLCFKSLSLLSQSGVLEGLQPTAAAPFYSLGTTEVHLSQ